MKIDPRIKSIEAKADKGTKVMICTKVEGLSGVQDDGENS